MQSFVLGAMIMGVGGAMYALNIRAIAPDTFEPFFGTFIIWAMLIVGGAGNNKGAILGALVVWGIWSGTGQLAQRMPDFLEVRVFYFRLMFIGMLIVGVLLLRPNGILGEERRVSIFVERQARREARKAKQPPGPQLPVQYLAGRRLTSRRQVYRDGPTLIGDNPILYLPQLDGTLEHITLLVEVGAARPAGVVDVLAVGDRLQPPASPSTPGITARPAPKRPRAGPRPAPRRRSSPPWPRPGRTGPPRRTPRR